MTPRARQSLYLIMAVAYLAFVAAVCVATFEKVR